MLSPSLPCNAELASYLRQEQEEKNHGKASMAQSRKFIASLPTSDELSFSSELASASETLAGLTMG
jgi:hypothetical protein